MSYGTSQKTLEQLEWPDVISRLVAHAETPDGREQIATGSRGSATVAASRGDALAVARGRLAETGEARSVLIAAGRPPLAGMRNLREPLARVRKDGALSPRELQEIGETLDALHATHRFLSRRSSDAPRLSERAQEIADLSDLADAISRCIDAAGEISDAASTTLADARRESRRLSTDIQERAEQFLRDADTVSRLTDKYYTVRNDRFVLPVRADARGSVRGIVHDASSSGNTLFIEPDALVDLNNRHKRAKIEIDREIRRILRDLSRRAAEESDRIEAGVLAAAHIDAAFARARYADELEAVAPEVRREGVLRLPQLRHPLIDPSEVVPNDVSLGETFTTLVISGPNAGGKTVSMKAAALAALFVAEGLFVPAGEGARVDLFDEVIADIGDEQDIREHLSTFSAHMTNLAQIVDRATPQTLVVLDEVGVGTDPGEGAALAQAVLEVLADAGARTIATTHYNLLKELAEVDDRFANASVEFDPETLEPTYRLKTGFPGASSATTVAARMGMRDDVLERANQILEREDRQLDRILSELSASRTALEREQLEIAQVREETESVRVEHQVRLERLRDRRDVLYRKMRDDLDRIFGEAHAQVASVIRELQRGGTAQKAARARESLLALEKRTHDREQAAGVVATSEAERDPIDWRRMHAGDPVEVVGAGHGLLDALPDRRGRVAVRIGGARLLVARERICALPREATTKTPPRIAVIPAESDASLGSDTVSGDASRCDLRGLRVDEAEDRLLEALDRAAGANRETLTVVHGVGSGALRDAVRRFLSNSPYVAGFAAAEQSEGGEGVTVATLG
ncbi:MAG: endonuclease MutS2 [Deltaproteobacteria bacterium]|nr:endonuclease MutS2 [Deltaproteobacteria bacterium]MBW2398596.1 endonuclease MutS2 [Deltaproteobacteria bacterium]